jgi:hypothetical protein
MSLTRSKIVENLENQERIEGVTENTRKLKKLAAMIKYHSEWSALVDTRTQKYGKHSYECYHLYYIKEHFKHLFTSLD